MKKCSKSEDVAKTGLKKGKRLGKWKIFSLVNNIPKSKKVEIGKGIKRMRGGNKKRLVKRTILLLLFDTNWMS